MSTEEDGNCTEGPTETSGQDDIEYEFPHNIDLTAKDLDSGWSWVVLFSSFGTLIFEGVSLSIVGLMHIYLLEEFQEDESTTAWAGSLLMGIPCLLGPVSSLMSDRWGCRTCVILGGLLSAGSLAISSLSSSLWMSIFTYGILNSCGNGIYLNSSIVIIGFYFKRHTNFASAISVLGVNFGIMMTPIIFSTLERVYGWRGAVLLLSGLVLHICIFGALQRPSALERQKLRLRNTSCWTMCKTKKNVSSCSVSKNSLLRNKGYMWLLFCFFTSNFAMSILYLHVPKYVIVTGGSVSDIQAIFLAMGSGGLLAKFLVGLASGLNKLCLLIGSYSIAGISLLILPSVAHSQLGRIVCLFVTSFYYNVEPPLYVPVSLEVVGIKSLAKGVGFELSGVGTGFALGPVIAALLLEYTENYSYSIYMAGAAYILSSISCIMVGLCSKSGSQKDQNLKSENMSSDV